MNPPMEVLPVWPALAACGTVALYLLAAAVGSLIYPFVIWEGGLRLSGENP